MQVCPEIKRVSGIPSNIKTQRREPWSGRTQKTLEIISDLSRSFWASNQIHQCPSFSFALNRVAFQFLDLWLGCNCVSTSLGWPGLLVILEMIECEGFLSICIGLVSSNLLEPFRQPTLRTFSVISSFTRSARHFALIRHPWSLISALLLADFTVYHQARYRIFIRFHFDCAGFVCMHRKIPKRSFVSNIRRVCP